MNGISTHSTLKRVLSIGGESTNNDFFNHALGLSSAPLCQEGPANNRMTTAANSSPVSFCLATAINWEAAHQEFKDALVDGRAYCLLVTFVQEDSWEIIKENIEKVWELDEGICCIVCLPNDPGEELQKLSLSRPEQWVMFRMSGRFEEFFQLATCLSARSSVSASDSADGSIITEFTAEFEHNRQYVDVSTMVDQQAELDLARDELATSKVYVNNVLRSMADSLLVIDANMTIGSANPALLGLLGYEEHELVGQAPGLIFGEEFAQGAIIENLLLQGSVSGIESSFLTSEGRIIPISVSGSLMQDEHGQFQGLVCVAQDITERKRMEEEKQQLHQQLLDTSRQLGMAEVASDVLHNVGNVLNSINVSIGVVADLVKNSMVGDVRRISQLFKKYQDDLGTFFSTNPKGKQIPPYLEKLSHQLIEEQRLAIAELDRLRETAQKAQHCVAAQQDIAKATGMIEPLSVVTLIEEALAVNQELLEASHIEVTREFQEIPLLLVDKYQVLDVLSDIFRNACQAMATVHRKQLFVRVKLIPGPPDSVCIEAEDSGIGIATEDLTKIFGQVYQTKDSGRGGSLHNGALVAKNLGGALRAHSDGLGRGATFSLDLPGNFHFPDL